MKRCLLLFVLLATPTLALAQPFQFGVLAGAGRSMEEGFDFDFDHSVIEVFVGARVDVQTVFNIKLGQTDTEVGPGGEPLADGKLDYVAGQVEYQFDEIWGSSSIFAGPGVYRARGGDIEETEVGLSGGVNALFPLTRRYGVLVELSYHWVNFDENYTFLTATGGLKVSF